jgi:hypothetical protein
MPVEAEIELDLLQRISYPDPAALAIDSLKLEAKRLRQQPRSNSTQATLTAMVWKGWRKEQAGILGEFRCSAVCQKQVQQKSFAIS